MTISKLMEKERRAHRHSWKHFTDFNNLVKFCDNSGLILLRSTTGVLSEPILFIGPGYLINLESWRHVKKNISISSCCLRGRKVRKAITLVLFKGFALSDKNKIHPEPFLIVGTNILPILRIWFGIFHNLLDPSRLLSAFVLGCLCIDTRCIFLSSLEMVEVFLNDLRHRSLWQIL